MFYFSKIKLYYFLPENQNAVNLFLVGIQYSVDIMASFFVTCNFFDGPGESLKRNQRCYINEEEKM